MDIYSPSVSSLNDSFSWRRVAMVWSYYSPVLRMQLWLWPLIAAGIYLMGMLTALSPVSMVSSFAVSGLSMLISFGPLMLVRSNALVCETMLPARADEKYAFYLLYFLIVVPSITLLTVGALHVVSTMVFGAERLHDYTYMLLQRGLVIKYTYGIGIFGEVIGIVACLFGVTAFTRNRALAGVGFVIGSGIVIGIIGGIMGIILAFVSGFSDGFMHEAGRIAEQDPYNTEAIMCELYESPIMRLITIVISSVAAMGSFVLGYLVLRSLRHRQL